MSNTPLTPIKLTCNHLHSPLGMDLATGNPPRLGWQLTGDGRNRRQTAWQVLVAASPEELAADHGSVWDSGKTSSDRSVGVVYAGAKPVSGQRCYWKVRAWDENDVAGPWSEPAWWEMGLLADTDWEARWISLPASTVPEAPPPASPLFRKEFTLDKPVRAARAYISGLGYYELRINGRRVGDHVLDPLFTRYDVRTLYVTHDITPLLQPGANAFAVMLGNGWYNCHTQEVWSFHDAPWRDRPKLMLQVQVEFADGTRQTLITDPTWKASSGPVVFDGLRNGETYDARREKPGWDQPGYADADWTAAVITPGPGGRLASQPLPIRVMQTVTPIGVNEVRPGVFVVDMGQNLTGWVQLTVTGPAGTEVVLRYGEKLTAAGEVDQSNINGFIKSGDCQTDRYIFKGSGVEVWEPRFTYHGFRWVQVTGWPGRPTVENFRARVVHSAFPSAGRFECSNPLLNRIQECTRWSYISNFVGIPTDCPHREKNGWMGDAMLAAETGLFNYAAAPAYRKWLDDMADVQRPNGQLPGIVPTGGWGFNWGSGPAWDSAYTHIPWDLYVYCGDRDVLERHYAGMKRYLEFMAGMANGHLLDFGLGDWCPPGGESAHKCPVIVTSTAYYYANAVRLARIAELLGKKADARRFHLLATRIRKAFNRAFYDRRTGFYRGEDLTSQSCALFQGLVDDTEQPKVLAALLAAVAEAKEHPAVGILGAKYLLNVLTAQGHAAVAYRIATQTDFPSWGHWLAQGATTLWETWEGTVSRNHIMFGDISAWMFKSLAGINPDPQRPGFQRVLIRPHCPDGLEWARGEHDSPHGTVRSGWRRENGRLVLEVELPPNTTARVHLPASDLAAVTESGNPLAQMAGLQVLDPEQGRPVIEIGSGAYRFTMAAC